MLTPAACAHAAVCPTCSALLAQARAMSLPVTLPLGAGKSPLTAAQTDVLRLLVQGLSNTEIAARLWVTEATVKTHLRHMLARVDADSRVSLAVWAIRSGVVE